MAKYYMQEMPDMKNEGKTMLYPKIEITGVCETEDLVASGVKGSSVSKAEAMAVLDLLAAEMAWRMAQGQSVRLEGIGLFTPSLCLKEGREREEPDGDMPKRNAASIRVGSINFRADSELVRETNKQCRLEKGSDVKRCKIPKLTEKERLEMLKKYLEENSYITVNKYTEISEQNRTKASMELKGWTENPESGITFQGKGTHKIFVKKKD